MAPKNLREAFCLIFHSLPDAKGRGKRAAIAAGYSEKSAQVTASQLLADPKILARLAELDGRNAVPMPASPGAHPSTKGPWPFSPPGTDHSLPPAQPPETHDPFGGEQTQDPLVLLERAMNNPKLDPKLRVDAAKALLPFKHAKLGEIGKKDQKAADAKNVASRFTPRAAPPGIHVVK